MANLSGNKKVVVAMSGGVDSSVAALLLKKAGWQVVGATLRLWVDSQSEKQAGDEARGCCSYDAVFDARKVAMLLDIPHYVFDMKEEFFEKIVCNFTAEYMNGRTPSPCIECNRTVKFSTLRQKARGLGIDYIATGHYARINHEPDTESYKLLKGIDRQKDQSYMLYILGQEELAATIFPLGDKTKEQVRKIAADNGLNVAYKNESQEICFIPDNDYRSFLKRTCPEVINPGDIVSTSGHKIGRHQGIAFYTVGQRKGLGLPGPQPLYVVSIDPRNNLIIVGNEDELYRAGLIADKLNFVSGIAPRKDLSVEVKIRYRAPAVKALLYPPVGGCSRLFFLEKQKAVTPGQSVVFYRDEEVIGGGIIEEAIPE